MCSKLVVLEILLPRYGNDEIEVLCMCSKFVTFAWIYHV
jgi:hypothetical protein